MTIQISATMRTNRSAAIETTIGTAPILELRSGAQPANCAAADSGTLLASMTLASDWASQSGGVLTFSNMPLTDTAANNAGTAGHYRIKDSVGTTCHMQGSVTATGGGGDMTLDNVSIAAAQEVRVTAWTITEPNA